MEERGHDAFGLHDQQVAFTGRLAALLRVEVGGLVRSLGAHPVRLVTSRTHLLVVGQAGLPLTRAGNLTRNLRLARRYQALRGKPLILTEEEFFDRLGLLDQAGGVRRLHGPAEVCRAIGVTRHQLRVWIKQGLIRPVKTVHGVALFDFRQTTAIKTLVTLARSGVSTKRLRHNLELVRQLLPGVDDPLEKLALLEQDGTILFRMHEGRLAEATGQLSFEFHEDEDVEQCGPPVDHRVPRTAIEYWETGLAHEEDGQLVKAAECYRHTLRLGGPESQVCFCLANVLSALGEHGRATERYNQAIELDPEFAEAWNNLGNALVNLGNLEEAAVAYREALRVDPAYGDSHYNLADALEQLGHVDAARTHWKAFLNSESDGDWAEHARRRLAAANDGRDHGQRVDVL